MPKALEDTGPSKLLVVCLQEQCNTIQHIAEQLIGDPKRQHFFQISEQNQIILNVYIERILNYKKCSVYIYLTKNQHI